MKFVNEIGKKTMLSIFILLLTATCLTMRDALASPTMIMSSPTVTAADGTVNVGDTFNITVSLNDVPLFFAWQVTVFFNATVLNCTSAPYPSNWAFAGKTYTPLTPVIDNVAGSVLGGSTLSGSDYVNVTTAQPLLTIVFTAKAKGQTGLHFDPDNTYMLDNAGNIITTAYQDGTVNVIPELSILLLPLALLATAAAIALSKKTLPKKT